MPQPKEITVSEARKLVLHAQGLAAPVKSALDAIRQLSYVQIDSISVAARSHHHVFFSRDHAYQEEHLDQMVAKREIFEYWSHAAAFLPTEDYRFSLYPKAQIAKADKFWFEKDKKVMRHVMRRIRQEGALQSKDFANSKDSTGTWYEWKPAKVALQQLFMEGKLMVTGRQGFQKIYDLTERVLPEGTDTKMPTRKGFYSYLVDRAITAQGLATEEEIRYLRKGSGEPVKRVLAEKLRKKELIKVKVAGVDELYYTTPAQLQVLDQLVAATDLYILNPFDNLVIQRKRMADLFDFDYQIECYVPEAKRKHGYYTLPILYGDRFVARLDPKVDRKNGMLNVNHLWFEEDFQPDDEFLAVFSGKLKAFARFCGCEELSLNGVTPPGLLKTLREALA